VTFWVAVLSLFAFVSGNMLGQHGWAVFWSSVLGGADDALIAYEGTVSPIPLVPDPLKWAKYGGDQRYNTFTQAPKDILISYPTYRPLEELTDPVAKRLYSVDFGGTYATGAGKGTHAGLDMTAPQGTPVVAAMNGIVIHAETDSAGYGNYIILRHPNVPDPSDPSKPTTLYSLYAHLDSSLVTKGELLKKGQQIGTVGKSGDATGFHLHFAIQRLPDAWWPFTYTDLKKAGLTFTQGIDTGFHRDVLMQEMTSPMAYVQSHYPTVMVASASTTTVTKKPTLTLAERKAQRLAKVALAPVPVKTPTPVLVATNDIALQEIVPVAAPVIAPIVPTPMPAAPVSAVAEKQKVASYRMETPYDFNGREWITVRVSLLNDVGELITDPEWEKDITLRTAFGQAQFEPEVLKKTNFKNGVATVRVLPRGKTTVVLSLMPQNVTSDPIRFANR
jgi:murein DD-endopeptidase MepM/ murein hydrolase activator NlpD